MEHPTYHVRASQPAWKLRYCIALQQSHSHTCLAHAVAFFSSYRPGDLGSYSAHPCDTGMVPRCHAVQCSAVQCCIVLYNTIQACILHY